METHVNVNVTLTFKVQGELTKADIASLTVEKLEGVELVSRNVNLTKAGDAELVLHETTDAYQDKY